MSGLFKYVELVSDEFELESRLSDSQIFVQDCIGIGTCQ